jgi:hypothetical protein
LLASGNQTIKGKQMITSFSMIQLFKKCRMACNYRYIQGLYKKDQDYKLWFGSLIHECLKIWHSGEGIEPVLIHINEKCTINHDDFEDEEEYKAAKLDAKKTWHYATALMTAYANRYAVEPFTINALEEEFDADMIGNTDFKIKIKADGLVYLDDLKMVTDQEHYLYGAEEGYYLFEHKTTSSLGLDYFDKLWTDLQIVLYSYYMQKKFDVELKGVLYNVLQKPLLKQSQGETEAEFKERYKAACAKNKSGKSSATRNMPESDDDFQARHAEFYSQPHTLQRKIHVIPQEKYGLLNTELLSVLDDFKRCCSSGVFYRNELSCFNFNTPCDFFPLCAGTKATTGEIIKLSYGVSNDRVERFKELLS